MSILLKVFNKFDDYWMCFPVDMKNNTWKLLMSNQYVLIKVSDTSSFQLKKSILVAKVEGKSHVFRAKSVL